MKRCPQCEFIYEDDQICCDMDGINLVFDPPAPAAISQQPAGSKASTSRRSLLAICAVVFGVLVLAIGYASLERAFTANGEPAVVTDAPANQTTIQEKESVPDKPVVQTVGEDPTVSVVSNTARASQLAARDPGLGDLASRPAGTEPLRRNSVATSGVAPDDSRPQPANKTTTPAAPPKKDSKVVSIVKKTGRFFTKPFKK
jgi:hypothetical protein